MKKIASVVVLYNPNKEVNENIQSYLHLTERLYIVDNSINDNSHLFTKNKKIKYIFLSFFLHLSVKKKWESGQKTRKPLCRNGFRLPTFEK